MHEAETSGSGQAGTVLVVDDDWADLRFTQRVVASVCPQFSTKSFESGSELIAYLQDEKNPKRTDPAVLILLDLRMNGMHGFEVLGWLRHHPPHNSIPVIVLTGSGEVLVTRQAYALGARSFLTKPLRANEFKETLVSMGKFPEMPMVDNAVVHETRTASVP